MQFFYENASAERVRFGLAVKYQYWYTLFMKPKEKLEALFYRSGTGKEPVRDWLKGLDAAKRKYKGDGKY